jgi:hypothetical protein
MQNIHNNNLIRMTCEVKETIDLNPGEIINILFPWRTPISPLLFRQQIPKMLGDIFEGRAGFGLGMKGGGLLSIFLLL